MKNTILYLFLAFIFSCNSNKKIKLKSDDFFEGVVTYSIEYKPYSDNVSPERLKELIGDKMVFTFKDGDFRKQFFSPQGKLLNERVLILKDEKSYSKSFENDTTYYFDITKHDSKTSFRQIKDSTILNHSTVGIETETMVSGAGFGDKEIKIKGAYYYAKNLKVNPTWYENYKEGNFNEIIKLGKGIQLLYINKGIYWEQIITAKLIESKKIKPDEIIFQIDENTILKEL